MKFNAATLAAGQAIPQPITRYAEAQLILAEAQGGTAAVNIINTMRAAVSLNPYTGPTDATSIKNLIASERQRALVLSRALRRCQERFASGERNADVFRGLLREVDGEGVTLEYAEVVDGDTLEPLDEVSEGEAVRLRLDPTASPAENAAATRTLRSETLQRWSRNTARMPAPSVQLSGVKSAM